MKIGLERQNTLMIWPSAIGAEIDFDRRARRDGRGVGIHLRDQRHQGRGGAHRADGAGGDIEKVAARSAPPKTRSSRLKPSPPAGMKLIRPRLEPAGPKSQRRRGGPLRQPCGKAGRRDRRRFIGTLAVRVQARYRACR